MLVKFVLDKKDVLSWHMDVCIQYFNSWVHPFTPFEHMFDHNAFSLIDIEIGNKSPEELLNHLFEEKDDTQTVQVITCHRLEKLQVARNNIKKAQEKQKKILI